MGKRIKPHTLLKEWLPTVILIGSLLCGGLASLISYSTWATRDVVQVKVLEDSLSKTIKYVDLQNEKTMKYVDDRITALRKESFDHSDFNKSAMESEYKGLSAKIDMLILMLQQKQGSNSK